ncbi:MAG: hypothetical protein ACR2Q4_11410, partial [Geminicoccaceae bacterium]
MAIHALVATIILLPLVITDIPLIADYPNHLARMHVLGNLTGNFFFQECCAVQFDFLPNLAMDLLVPVLAKLMSLPTAGQCFLLLTLISTLGSVALLHRVLFNLWSFYPLLAAFFLYHGSLMAGMVNFSLGIGLVPAALALWIAGRETSFARRLFLGSVVALVLYFCHLVALGIYALALLGYELMRMYDQLHAGTGLRRIGTDMAIAGATGILPLCLFVRLVRGEGPVEGSLLDAATSSLSWGTWSWKAKALIAPLSNYNLPLDLLTFGALAGLAIWGWWSGRLIIERRMAASLG